MAQTKVTKNEIDWSGLSNNIKSMTNPANISVGNGVNSFGYSLYVNFDVETACKAMVTLDMGIQSATDYEFQPIIFLDGVEVARYSPPAATGGSRARHRGFTTVINIPAGSHMISGGVNLSSGSSYLLQTLGAYITAFALGNVKA